MRHLCVFSFLLLGAIGLGAFAPESRADDPVVESVEGAGATLTLGGQTIPLAEGAALPAGSHVVTDNKTAVRIVYPDETGLQIGRGSAVELESQPGKPPTVNVEKGDTRAIVTPAPAAPAPGQTKPGVKFMIRTKSVVMGVRGTDFVAQSDPDGTTSVHLLQGQLAVGKPGEEDGLFSNGGVVLKQNESLVAQGQLGAPQPFKRAEFLQALVRRQPVFRTFMIHPALKYAHARNLKDHPRKHRPPVTSIDDEKKRTPGKPRK